MGHYGTDPTKHHLAGFATSFGKILTIFFGPNQYGEAKFRPSGEAKWASSPGTPPRPDRTLKLEKPFA
jgi:hypothetical protein